MPKESRFSSQPVPRLPSFKFKEGRNFLDDLDLPDVPSLQDAKDKLSIVPERHSDSMGSMTSWLDISPTGETARNLSRPYSANDTLGASEEGRKVPAAMLRLDSASTRASRFSSQVPGPDITRSTSVSAPAASSEPNSRSPSPDNSASAPAAETQQNEGSILVERRSSQANEREVEPSASAIESRVNPEPSSPLLDPPGSTSASQQGSGPNEIEQRDSQGSEQEIARSASISAPNENGDSDSSSLNPSNSAPAPVVASREKSGSTQTHSQGSGTPQPETSPSASVEPSHVDPESTSSSPNASRPASVSVVATQQHSESTQTKRQSSQPSESEAPPPAPVTGSQEGFGLTPPSDSPSSASAPVASAAQDQSGHLDAHGSEAPKSEDSPSAPVVASQNENAESSSPSPDASGTTSALVVEGQQDNGSTETMRQDSQASESEIALTESGSASHANLEPASTSTASDPAPAPSVCTRQDNGSTQPDSGEASSAPVTESHADPGPASASPDDSASAPPPVDSIRQDSGSAQAEPENVQPAEQEISPSSRPQSSVPAPVEVAQEDRGSTQSERVNSQGSEQGTSPSSRPQSPAPAHQQESDSTQAGRENTQPPEQGTSSLRSQSSGVDTQKDSGSNQAERENAEVPEQETSPSSRPQSSALAHQQERESTHAEREDTRAPEQETSSRSQSSGDATQKDSVPSQVEQPNSQARERDLQPSTPVTAPQANTQLAPASQDRQNSATASGPKPVDVPGTPHQTSHQMPRSRTTPSRRPDLAKSMSKPLPSLPPLAEQLVVPRPWIDDPHRDNANISTRKSRSQKPTTESRSGREKSSRNDHSSSADKTKKPTKSSGKPAKDSKSSEKHRSGKEHGKEKSSRTKESTRISPDGLRISQLSIDPEKNEPLTARPVTVEPQRPIRVITLTKAVKNRDKESRKSRESNAGSVKTVSSRKPVATSNPGESAAGEAQSRGLRSPVKAQFQKTTGGDTPSGSPRPPQTDEAGSKRDGKTESNENVRNEHGAGAKATNGTPSVGIDSREKPAVSQASANATPVDLQDSSAQSPGQPQRSDTLVMPLHGRTGSQVSLDRGCLSRAHTFQGSPSINLTPMNSTSELRPPLSVAADNPSGSSSGANSPKTPASRTQSSDNPIRGCNRSVSMAASGADLKSKFSSSERAFDAENSPKSAVPFPNRFKFLGLRSKTVSEINAQMATKPQGQAQPDKTVAREPTQRKFVGSRKGTLSRFSVSNSTHSGFSCLALTHRLLQGWFSRSGSTPRSDEKRETQYTTTWAVQPSQPPVDVGLSYRFSQLSYAPYLHTLGSEPRGHESPVQANEPKPDTIYKKYDDPSSFDAIRPSSQTSYSTKEPIFYSPQQVLEIHRSRSVGSPQVSGPPTSTGTPRTGSPDEQERGRNHAPDQRQRSRSPLPEPVPDREHNDDSKADNADTDKSKARMSVVAADLREKMPVEDEPGPKIKGNPQSPVELPVPGDDWSEKIEMTSTAYPGQEWHPDGFEHWSPY